MEVIGAWPEFHELGGSHLLKASLQGGDYACVGHQLRVARDL